MIAMSTNGDLTPEQLFMRDQQRNFELRLRVAQLRQRNDELRLEVEAVRARTAEIKERTAVLRARLAELTGGEA